MRRALLLLPALALGLPLAGCGARPGAVAAVAAAAVRGANANANANAAKVVDAPAGDAEATCARQPVAAEASTFFASATIEPANSLDVASSNGDLWPSCATGTTGTTGTAGTAGTTGTTGTAGTIGAAGAAGTTGMAGTTGTTDDALITAWGDGFGFRADRTGKRPDIGVGRLAGRPWGSAGPAGLAAAPLSGENLAEDTAAAQSVFRVWTKGPYYQKPTGLLCRPGRVYLAVQDLDYETYDDAPAATIASSGDGGRTWVEAATPMFHGGVFTTIMFLDAGGGVAGAAGATGEASASGAPGAAGEPYAYAYGLDHNWRASDHVLDPQGLYLARIAADRDPQSLASWEFFAGLDAAGAPTWTRDIAAKRAVLVDCTRRHPEGRKKGYAVIGQGGVVYDAPLRRYLYTSWTEYTFEFYEAPTPWGPWRRFLSKDFGLPPWTPENHGGYGTSIPSRFISADGKTLWVQSNTWSSGVDHNDFALRKLVVTVR